VKLKVETQNLQLAHPWSIARSQGNSEFKVVVIELTDGAGVRGLGEASPVARYGESAETVSNLLKRIDMARLSFEDVAAGMDHLHSLSTHDQAAI
jgi:L-alanine-DL-glutamate epimerase-like enolase superfamily enzyme